MATVLQRHRDRVLAEKRAAAGARAVPAVARAEAGLRGLLATHLAELQATKSRERKTAAKARMLPDYASHVEAVLAADAGGRDDVLMTVMVWRLDAGDYDGALAIAAYALKHNVPLPQRFARDLPDLLVEEIAEAALEQTETVGAAEGGQALEQALGRALDLTAAADLHDAVATKAHKALGRLRAETAPAAAADHLETALRLDPKGAGVKTELARLRKRLVETGPGDAKPDDAGPDDD